MTTPTTFPDPAREIKDPKVDKAVEAYEQGPDANHPSIRATYLSPTADAEKDIQSTAASTLSGEEPLAESPAGEPQTEPDIVDWDGPDDPENPLNWTKSRKWRLIACLGAMTLVTPLASFFALGVPQVMRTFGESSNVIAALVVSIYILGLAHWTPHHYAHV